MAVRGGGGGLGVPARPVRPPPPPLPSAIRSPGGGPRHKCARSGRLLPVDEPGLEDLPPLQQFDRTVELWVLRLRRTDFRLPGGFLLSAVPVVLLPFLRSGDRLGRVLSISLQVPLDVLLAEHPRVAFGRLPAVRDDDVGLDPLRLDRPPVGGVVSCGRQAERRPVVRRKNRLDGGLAEGALRS